MAPLRSSGWKPSNAFAAARSPAIASAYAPRSRNPWIAPENKLTLGGKDYDRALHIRCDAELEYALRGNFRRFSAVVGIHPTFSHGAVNLKIIADGRTLFDDTILKESGAKALDLDVTGVRQLKIVAVRKYPIGDAIDLCEARVTK
jgi:hypothetical protein